MSSKLLKRVDLSPSCKALCGHDLRRPHLTCLYCRIRRMRAGELPKAIEVKVLYLTVRLNPPRRFARVRDILLKRVLNVAEMLAA